LYKIYVYFFFRANVKLTDLPENLPQLKQNVDENTPWLKGCVQTVALTWGTTFESEPFDFVLMADCIYYPEVLYLNCFFFIVSSLIY